MAEFQDVMRQWKRMCDAHTTDDAESCCKGCPISGRGCGSIYESNNAEPDIIEREVMSWVAEHPEPVYPTWLEWLHEQGIYTGRVVITKDEMDVDVQMTGEIYNPIPADIAQKLGIEPKEG